VVMEYESVVLNVFRILILLVFFVVDLYGGGWWPEGGCVGGLWWLGG